jgi:hypothetical protein
MKGKRVKSKKERAKTCIHKEKGPELYNKKEVLNTDLKVRRRKEENKIKNKGRNVRRN